MKKKVILIGLVGLMMLTLSSPGWATIYDIGDYLVDTAYGPFAGPEIPGAFNGYNFPNSGDYEFTVLKDGPGGANTSVALVEAALEAVHGGNFTLFDVTTYITNPGGYSGEWTTDNPATPPGDGQLVDFYAVKAANMFALYAEVSPVVNGTWNVENVQTGGGTAPGISHLAGYFTEGTPNNGEVPEPATMILLGSGLVGLAGYGRKKFFKK